MTAPAATFPQITPAADPAAAYAQAMFNGCAAALSTLLNRSVTLEFEPPVHPPTDALHAILTPPWYLGDARFTRGIAGAHDVVVTERDAVLLGQLLLGEDAPPDGAPTSDQEDAIREIFNQMLSSASSSLKVFFGKPVSLSMAELRHMESAEGWAPHGAVIAIGRLAIDGVPRARMAVTIPSTVRDEAAAVLQAAAASQSAATNGSALPGLELILDISMPVTVELGRTRMLIRDILGLGPGSVIELDKLAGEPVDLLVNDRAIAKGEVVVIDENFGIRLTQISQATDRIRSLA